MWNLGRKTLPLLFCLACVPSLALATPGAPVPGYYRIRGLESQMCVGYKVETVPQVDHFVLKACEPRTDQDIYVAIIPIRGRFYTDLDKLRHQLYTVRPYFAVGNTPARKLFCATQARGVVFGAPRLDIHRCDFDHDANAWCDVGGSDQRFYFEDQGGSYFIIMDGSWNWTTWDVREHGHDAGTDLLVMSITDFGAAVTNPHSNFANKKFELLYDRPLDTADDIACLPH